MSASSSNNQLPVPPPAYPRTSDSQWIMDNGTRTSNHTSPKTLLQYAELPLPQNKTIPMAASRHSSTSLCNVPVFYPSALPGYNFNRVCAPNGPFPQIGPTYSNVQHQHPSNQIGVMNGGNCWNPSRSSQFVRNEFNNASTNRPPASGKPKRNRTAFTGAQMEALEQQYAINHYLTRNRRIELSEILNLPDRTIKIWFQNRRMKDKKDKEENFEYEYSDAASSATVSPQTTDSSPETHTGLPVMIKDPAGNDIIIQETYFGEQSLGSNSFSMYNATIPQNAMIPQNATIPQTVNYYPFDAYQLQNEQAAEVQMQMYAVPAYSGGIQGLIIEEPHETTTEYEIQQSDPPLSVEVPSTDNSTEDNWDLSLIQSIIDGC